MVEFNGLLSIYSTLLPLSVAACKLPPPSPSVAEDVCARGFVDESEVEQAWPRTPASAAWSSPSTGERGEEGRWMGRVRISRQLAKAKI